MIYHFRHSQCQHHRERSQNLHHSHTSPYSFLSESSCSSSSSSICTNSSELCCCVPVTLGALLHLQPGPHRRVLHAVTLEHEQPRNNRPSWYLTASLFSTDSQSHSSFPSTIYQPYCLIPHVRNPACSLPVVHVRCQWCPQGIK